MCVCVSLSLSLSLSVCVCVFRQDTREEDGDEIMFPKKPVITIIIIIIIIIIGRDVSLIVDGRGSGIESGNPRPVTGLGGDRPRQKICRCP